jgi:superfamily II DNA or RNA helicase
MEWLKLRDYQVDALNSAAVNFFAVPEQQAWRQLGVLPTGSGKTVIAGTLPHQEAIKQWLESFPEDQRKILFIAHTDELLKQAKNKIKFYNPDLVVEIEKAEQYASLDADVVVASIQTLASRQGKRVGRFDKDQFRVIIIDEAHHAVANSYIKVLQYFDLLPPDEFMPKTRAMAVEEAMAWQRSRLENWDLIAPRERLLLGITATSKRGDKIGLELVFQRIVFQRNMLDQIRAGYLANLRALRINSKVNLDEVKSNSTDLDQVELAKAINTQERHRLIVKAYLEHAKGLKTIAFTVNVAQAESLAAEFNAQGVRAVAVSGQDADDDRAQRLESFASGNIDVVVNCQILTEGFDDPYVECIIMARPTKSQLLYVQMAGRGVRLHPKDPVGAARVNAVKAGKTLLKSHCLILDIADVTSKHRLIGAPSLLGLPANFDTQGEDLVEMLDKVEKLLEKQPFMDLEKMLDASQGAKTLEQIEFEAREVDLFEPFHDPEIVNNSDLAWMKANNKYEINFQGPVSFETLSISQNDLGQWQIMLREFGNPRAIMPPTPDVHEAFERAEMWLNVNRPLRVDDLKRSAGWRKAKPNDRQLKLLKKYKLNVDTSKLTRGDAASMINLYESKRKKR